MGLGGGVGSDLSRFGGAPGASESGGAEGQHPHWALPLPLPLPLGAPQAPGLQRPGAGGGGWRRQRRGRCERGGGVPLGGLMGVGASGLPGCASASGTALEESVLLSSLGQRAHIRRVSGNTSDRS